MMKLALIITHNKTDAENFDQIEVVKPLITKITETHDQFNEQGNKIGTFDAYHYEIKNLGIPHELRVYQIIPYGINEPTNFNNIDSHNVIYRNGDEDKTGDHARFFNWGMKRGTDYGADIVIHLEDYKKLNFSKLIPKFQTLSDKTNTIELIEDQGCTITTLKLLKEVGQLNESKTKSQSLNDFKDKLLEKGFKHG